MSPRWRPPMCRSYGLCQGRIPLCFWPSAHGQMHRGAEGAGFPQETIRLCHQARIAQLSILPRSLITGLRQPSRMALCYGRRTYLPANLRQTRGAFKKQPLWIVCPNNPESGNMCDNLQELNRLYHFEDVP